MASAKDRIKLTGDTHMPEVESDDFDNEASHPEGTGTEDTQARRRVKGETTGKSSGDKPDPGKGR